MTRRFSPEAQAALVQLVTKPEDTAPISAFWLAVGKALGFEPRPVTRCGYHVTHPGKADRWDRFRAAARTWVEHEVGRRQGVPLEGWKPAVRVRQQRRFRMVD